jgi:PAS domain S-box-containing protein
MNWVTVIWSMTAGICLTLAALHLLVWLRARDSWMNAVFSISALAAAACAGLELVLMHSQTPAQWGEVLRWTLLPSSVLVISLVWFIRLFLGAGRTWLAWLICGVRALVLALDFLVAPNLHFREITALRRMPLWGEMVSVPIGVLSPWASLRRVSLVLFLVYVIDAAIAAWKQGTRRQGLVMGGTMSFAIVLWALGGGLLDQGILPAAFIAPIFLLIVLVIGYELSSDVARATQLAWELRETQERMSLATTAADLGVWDWDIARDEIWVNAEGRAQLGIGASEHVNVKRFLQSLHPNDRERSLQAILPSPEGGEEFEVEYRVATVEGATHWIGARGRMKRGANGKPLRAYGVSVDITERKNAEEALRASEKQLLRAQEMAHLGYWQWDVPRDVITWSDEVYRIYGLDPQIPLTYEGLLEAVHPEDREYHNYNTAEWLKNHGGPPYEYRIVRPDGSIRYIYAIGEVECDEAGAPIRFVGTLQDVTESRLAERRLRESEARFRATFEQAAVGIAHAAPSGRFLRINRRFCDILGYSQEEMLERTFQDITHPEDLDAHVEQVERLLRGEVATYTMEKRYIRKDSSPVWVSLTVSLVRNEAGEPGWLVGVVQDISERKIAEENSRKAAELNERVLASLHSHIAILNRSGAIIAVNDAWNEFALANGAVACGLGINYLDVCRSAASAGDVTALRALEGIQSVLEGASECFEAEYSCDSPAQHRSFLMRVVPLRTSDGGAVVSHTDITQLRRAEVEAQELRRDLAHVQRASTMGVLASALAHELNQPLGAILRNAEAGELFLQQNPPDHEEVRAILADIRRDDQRAGAVIDRMRSLLKRRDQQLESLSLKELLDHVAVLMRAEMQARQMTVRLEVPSDLPLVQGDRVQLQQVLVNLLMNGMDAANGLPSERRWLVVSARRADGETVEVAVSDRGHGIPAEKLAHLFEPFWTTKSEGLGVGLAISQSIIGSHGGRIQAENNPDGGATFRFTLKVSSGREREKEVEAGAREAAMP